MNNKLKWTTAAYLAITIYVVLSNLAVDTTTSKIASSALTGENIPSAYLASIPAVVENRGVAPPYIQRAAVTPYVVESHRGWPWRIEDNYEYRYDLLDSATGYTGVVGGPQTQSGVNAAKLTMNCIGPLIVLAILHLSAYLAVRNFASSTQRLQEPQLGG